MFFAGFIAAAVSGLVGFGGALLLLSVMIGQVGPVKAVPLLTFAQLVGNLARLALGFKSVAWRPVAYFSVAAVPSAAVGAAIFLSVNPGVATRVAGGVIVLVVLLSVLPGTAGFAGGKSGMWIPSGLGAVSGLISGLAGSAGPLSAACFWSLSLAPAAYIASEAAAACLMHVVKMVVYWPVIGAGCDWWAEAATLALAMIGGSWVGRKLLSGLATGSIRTIVGLLLFLSGIRMIMNG
ncbi:MAG: sulfite exporter TauE/SafE family protein [Negativicutes bacterium]|nr:sulfite exporter TauE/SafE family protein [Negativicutes bacterium]